MVKRISHFIRIASLEANVPKSVRHPEAAVDPLGTVMVEVMPTGIAEVRVAELVEVHRMMDPLGDDVSNNVTRLHHRQCVERSEVA